MHSNINLAEKGKDNRVGWIDCLKALGIYLVILGHTLKDSYLSVWIYSFHMPLFFILSGYLIGAKSNISDKKEYLKRKSKSLLLPFIVFRVLLVTYWLLIESHFRELDLGPIWFLIILFFVEISIVFVFTTNKNLLKNSIITVGVILFYLFLRPVLPDEHYFYPWVKVYLNGTIWFCLGFLSRSVTDGIDLKKNMGIALMILSFLVSICFCNYNGSVSIYSDIVNNYLLFLFFGAVGTLSFFLFSKLVVKKNRLLEYIGKYTIVILAVHEPIKRILLKSMEVISGISVYEFQHNDIYAIVISLFVLSLTFPVIQMFKIIKNRTGRFGEVVLGFIK